MTATCFSKKSYPLAQGHINTLMTSFKHSLRLSADFPFLKKAMLTLSACMLFSWCAQAQWDPSCNWNPRVGTTYQYSYTHTASIKKPKWTMSYGTVASSWVSEDGLTAFCTINWPSVNDFVLTLSSTAGVLATEVAYVSCPGNNVPTFSISGAAGVFTITATPGEGGNNVYWYTAASGGTSFRQALSYTTPQLASTTTYYLSTYFGTYVDSEAGTQICQSIRIPVTVTVVPPPPPTYTIENHVCSSGVAQIMATPGAGGTNVRWFNAAGEYLYEGFMFDTPSISRTTTYYIATIAPGYVGTKIPVTINVYPLPERPTFTEAQRCGPGQVTLTATPNSGEQIRWYDAQDNYITDGASYSPSINSTTSYHVRALNTSTSTWCQSNFVSVTATINPIPGLPAIQPATTCSGKPAQITGTSGSDGNTIHWYDVSTGGASVESTTYTTVALSSAATYYASSYNTLTACEGTRRSIQVTVNTTPAAPSLYVVNGICSGSGSGVIGANVGNGGNQVKWYETAASSHSMYTGADFGTPVISTATSWYVVSSNSTTGCESFPRTQFTLSPTPLQPPVSVVPAVRCDAGAVTLSATPEAAANGIRWYASPIDDTEVNNQVNFITPELSMSATYYAASYNSVTGCTSAIRTPVAAVIRPKPRPLFIQSTPAYGSGAVTLSVGYAYSEGRREIQSYALNDTTELQVLWFANEANALANTPVLKKGLVYTTPLLAQTTTYYARLQDKVVGCLGDPGMVTATVIPFLIPQSVQSDMIRVAGKKDEAALVALTAAEQASAVTYLDGMGRTHQQVIRQGSPLGKDVVQPVDFDNWGRASKTFLPYVASTTNGSFHSAYLAEQASFYQTSGDKITDDTKPYAVTVYEDSPAGRVVEQGKPGVAFQPGTNHTTRLVYAYNTGATSSSLEEVRNFNADGSSSGFFTANKLTRIQSTDADGKKQVIFQDGSGNTIVQKQQLDLTIDGVMVNWLETYYIYDDFGRVRYMISPKGVAALKSNGWTFSAIKDNYVHQFVYDARGRIIEKKAPGQAWTYMVYDNMNRVALLQDGLQRAANKWSFMKYDQKGRTVMQGIYLNATQTTRATMQIMADALYTSSNATYPANAWYESRGTALHGYSNTSFPKTNADNTALEVWNVSYYDNYDFDFNGTDDFSYTAQSLVNENTPATFINGFATGSKKLVVNTSTWIYTYAFYDEKGRVIQVRSNNHLNSVADNLVTSVYDFEGKLLMTKKYHHAAGTNITTVVNKFSYDNTGRLLQVYQNNNGAANDQLVAQYAYNELGQVVDKKLHNTTGTDFLQSVDYRYTLHGQLLSINNAQLTSDSGATNDDTNDYFGMEYLYNGTASGLGSTALFNGNISAVIWKGAGSTSGTADRKSYKYIYDKSNKLSTATSQLYSGTWTKEAGALNENMTYDHNGNIKTLQRSQRKHQLAGLVASYVAESMDELTYAYNTITGDRLEKVTDAANTAGFSNGSSATNTDFTYDGNGNVLSDLNKGISAITYNLQGKASQVTFSDGRVISYVYDGAGNKLSMSVTKSGTTTVTHYTDGFVYEGTVLSFFGSPEGRVVNKGGSLEYQYSIADHQGNTRVVFSAAPVTALTKTATMESATNSDFQNYPTGGSRNSLSLYNHTAGGTYSQLLNGGNNSQIGVAKSYKVYPGDKVKINAYAKYANLTSNTSNVSAFASALLNTFLLPAPLAGEAGTASRALNDWGSIVAVGGDGQSNAAPRVSVNIIVFDKNYNFLDAAFDQIDPAAEQVGITPVVAHDLLSKEYTVKEEGYVFMYIANENQTQVDAYFDDVAMTYTPTNIVQYNEYYPFGLQASTSWTRENNTNNFLYNEGSELNADAGWYETMFRGYDATLGRFMQVDPLAHLTHNMSPYQYANNSPALRNDPYGLKSPAPPGVSQMGWDRINKIRNPDFYTASWAESFSEYNRERDEREGNYDGGGGIGGGFGGNGSGYYSLFEYRYFYDDGVEAANKRHTEWEWVGDQTQNDLEEFANSFFSDEVKWIMQYLNGARPLIFVIDDNVKTNYIPGKGGVGGRATSTKDAMTIYINRAIVGDFNKLYVFMAHELTHALDFTSGFYRMWIAKFGTDLADIIKESHAYDEGAKAALRLGLPSNSDFGQNATNEKLGTQFWIDYKIQNLGFKIYK